MTDVEVPEDVKRWTTKRKGALVLSILRGETTVQEAARQHGLTVAEVQDWRDKFLIGAENGLRAKPKDEESLKGDQIKQLKQKVGELVLDIDILNTAHKVREERLKEHRPPFLLGTQDEF